MLRLTSPLCANLYVVVRRSTHINRIGLWRKHWQEPIAHTQLLRATYEPSPPIRGS